MLNLAKLIPHSEYSAESGDSQCWESGWARDQARRGECHQCRIMAEISAVER